MKQDNDTTPDMTETPDMNDIPHDDIAFEEVNEEGEVDARTTIQKLREKVKQLEKEKQDNQNGWTRAQADYINFKKEVDVRRKDDVTFANKGLIEDLLPSLDAYTMAQGNKEAWEKVDEGWRKGIEYIFSQIEQTFASYGLMSYGVVGDTFDPTLHESVEMVTVADEGMRDKLVAVLQKGYKLHDKVLRVARVKVGHTG